MANPGFAQEVKEADLAGSWYPRSKEALYQMLKGYLDQASPEKIDGDIIALISPHAGYQFSAPIAAYGFKAAEGRHFKTVIVLGFSHRLRFGGISVYARGVFRTPLGDIAIDEALAQEIISTNSRIQFNPVLFDGENSVEMQIPFVQMVFAGAKVVPVAFGTQEYEDAEIMADALAAALKDRKDVLIVASTDLSHYHPYAEANSIDQHTVNVLTGMKAGEFYQEGRLGVCELCGMMPVTASLLTAEKLGYNKIKVLKYANSGDTFGDKGKVVGYLSAAIYKESSQTVDQRPQSAKRSEASPKGTKDQRTGSAKQDEKTGELPMLNGAERKRLLQIARESIVSHIREGKRQSFAEADPVLNRPMGAFVTLRQNGELRGCIGNLTGQGPLYQTIADMAVESATGDPRFPPLASSEIGNVDIEISVLSEMKRVKSADEVKIPGHGVLIRKGYSSGVFLPQVADETGWSKEEFLSNLCSHKAGLPPGAWKDPATEIYIFTAEVFGEKE